jgi:hypothetical protein
VVFAGAAVLAGAPATAGAATAQQVIAALNAQRAANGIPAGITENTTWSDDCSSHDNYMAMNDMLTHTETVGNPGYSTGGTFAGQNAVLLQGTDWNNGNPYESAPLHLDQLLAPRLDVLGSADAEGYSCTTTFPGWTRPAPASPTIYTYPGNGASIYPEETVNETPFSPGTLVGLDSGTRTGPILIVLVDPTASSVACLSVSLSGATLTGPSGLVPVATVDGATSIPGGGTLACYISPGGFIIPSKPLKSGATYHAHVLATSQGVSTGHDWTFTAGGMDPHSALTLNRRSLRFSSSSPAKIRVKFTRTTGAHAHSVRIRPGKRLQLKLPPGSWQACGHQPPAHGYTSYDECVSILVTGVPTLHFGQPRRAGPDVRFPLRFTKVLSGRDATLTVIGESCSAGRCKATAGATSTRTITLQGRALTVPLPAGSNGLRLKIATAAFQLGDAPWLAAHAVSPTYPAF